MSLRTRRLVVRGALALALVVAVLSGCTSSPTAEPATTAPPTGAGGSTSGTNASPDVPRGPSTAPTPSPVNESRPLPYRGTCRSAHIQVRVARVGSEASAPFLVIRLTNTSTSTCTMDGYVSLAASADTSAQPLPLAISRGTYEVSDPGPTLIVLKAHRGRAYFVLGTETAHGGGANAVRITRLQLGLGSHQHAVSLALPANEQIGTTPNQYQRYVAGLTALSAHPPAGLQPTH
jgi:Protein of unknown function (DUF4232)